MIDLVFEQYNYWVAIFLMMTGFYTVISSGNLLKQIIGLNIFQAAVFILYISVAYIDGGNTPVVIEGDTLHANPLPHVLILTAIVVGIATTAVGLALIVRIKEAYGAIDEDEIRDEDDDPADNKDGAR